MNGIRGSFCSRMFLVANTVIEISALGGDHKVSFGKGVGTMCNC